MKASKNKQVLVVVLNWNGLDYTGTCCASLATQTVDGLKVLVVDNGSTAHTVDALKASVHGAEVLALPGNSGFAGGVNAGLQAADWEQFDYVWLLNNDTVCDPDALERLVAKAESDTGLAAVGCEMRESVAGQELERTVSVGQRLRPPFYIPGYARHSDGIDYLCGACLLIRREALTEVGLFDEGFFFFFEDADWSFRARRMGWRLGVAEGAPVFHAGGGTIRQQSENRARFYRTGHVRFLRKHVRFPFPAAVVTLLYRMFADCLKGHFSAVRGSVRGFWAGWRGVLE